MWPVDETCIRRSFAGPAGDARDAVDYALRQVVLAAGPSG